LNFKNLFIILVEPKYSGNIGYIARLMQNFQLENLVLVTPRCKIDLESYKRAMHATKILEKAICIEKLSELNMDYLVGTTANISTDERKYLRLALESKEAVKKILSFSGKVGIVFGREDNGLSNEELKICDLLINIPTSIKYKELSISHACAIIFYDLFTNVISRKCVTFSKISKLEREKLIEKFHNYLKITNYPKHKFEKTVLMFRRIIGRANISTAEFHTLMGVLNVRISK